MKSGARSICPGHRNTRREHCDVSSARLVLSTALDLLFRQHAQDMLHAVPGKHSIVPACEVGIFCRIPGILCIFQDVRDLSVPHDEGEVRVCALITHEPATVSEMGVEDFSDTVNLIVVAFAGRRERFWMEEIKPGEFEEVS